MIVGGCRPGVKGGASGLGGLGAIGSIGSLGARIAVLTGAEVSAAELDPEAPSG